MWNLPRPGLEPVSPALAGRFPTTAPPGKPLCIHSYLQPRLLLFPTLPLGFLSSTWNQRHPLWQWSCWFPLIPLPGRITVVTELEQWGCVCGGVGIYPGKKVIDSHTFFLRFCSFSLNKCFSVCSMPFVGLQSPQIVVFDYFVQFYHCFWGRGFAKLFWV